MNQSSQAVLTMEQSQAALLQDSEMTVAVETVAQLDFSMLKRKLVEEKSWTYEYCEQVEDLYRKFLALNVRYPDKKICPSGPIDEFWHAHILDTHAYHADCEKLFGEFLHHFPYFGMRGKQDKQNLENAFADSVTLFISHFGIDPTAGDVQARSCRPQRCP